jgi:uncharacterized membrane protein
MKSELTSRWTLPPTWWRFLIVILLVAGVFFRFVNLGDKVYWHDETLTSLTISGYRWAEMIEQVFDGSEIGIEDLQKFQRTNPEKGLIDTVSSLAVDFPEHPPLYYAIAHLWNSFFGNSPAVTRSLSAFFSLFAFPSIYWLCLELFESSLVGWIAIAILAVSPFHMLYAQEAREYSLWTVAILLMSASLLRSLRVKNKSSWAIYATTVTLGLYTYPFSALVVIGHGIYVLISESFRITKTLIAFAIAAIAGFLAFAPWIIVILTNPGSLPASSWTSQKMAILSLIQIWIGNLSRIFFDLNLDSKSQLIYTVAPTLLVLILIGYSLYFLCRTTSKNIWLFVLTLIVFNALSLILPDLILGGRRSSVSRYMLPSYLGIQLAVAYLINAKTSVLSFSRRMWQIIVLVIISSGFISCAVSSQAETWWNKKNSHNNPQTARIINAATRPLLVSSNYNLNPGELLSLSYLLDPKVRLLLVLDPNIPKLPDGFSDVFVFNPSKKLRYTLVGDKKQKLEQVYPAQARLWRIKI